MALAIAAWMTMSACSPEQTCFTYSVRYDGPATGEFYLKAASVDGSGRITVRALEVPEARLWTAVCHEGQVPFEMSVVAWIDATGAAKSACLEDLFDLGCDPSPGDPVARAEISIPAGESLVHVFTLEDDAAR